MLRTGLKIIEDVLLVVKAASCTPLKAILSTAPVSTRNLTEWPNDDDCETLLHSAFQVSTLHTPLKGPLSRETSATLHVGHVIVQGLT